MHRWQLNDKQFVEISTRKRVAFRHCAKCTSTYRGISLTLDEFKNFDNVIMDKNFIPKSSIPLGLGKSVWFCCGKSCIKLYSGPNENTYHRFFRFNSVSYDKYMKDVHNKIKQKLIELYPAEKIPSNWTCEQKLS